jgi:hypothetical protein
MAKAYYHHVAGPTDVRWGGSSAAYSLGVNKSGVTLRVKTSWDPIYDEYHGLEPANYVFAGKSATVECIALNMAALLNSAPWSTIAGLGGSGMTVAAYKIGKLAIGPTGNLTRPLYIVEANGTDVWIALTAIPLDVTELTFRSTQELQVPVSFLIVPDDDEQLFSTVPAYIQSA